jgi:hypothetical protein
MRAGVDIVQQSLRWTATFPIVTWFLSVVVMTVDEPATRMSGAGEFALDLCRAFIHDTNLSDDLVALHFLLSYVAAVVRGLRNRTVPLWLAVTGIASFAVVEHDESWRLSCGGPSAQLGWKVWMVATALMYLHQITCILRRFGRETVSPSSEGSAR